MLFTHILSILIHLLISDSIAKFSAPEPVWVDLFNGSDLSGWTPKIAGYPLGENFGETFRVRNGEIQVSYENYTAFNARYGHLFYEKPFGNYLLEIEYRFFGDQAPGGEGWAWRNSGVMLHCQAPKTMGLNQDFPISIEAQFLGGDGKEERSTCNLCTPGTHVVMEGKLVTQHCISSQSKTYAGDQWVRARFLVLGDSLIRHYAGKDLVLSYNKPQVGGAFVNGHNQEEKKDGQMLQSGFISLQSESHPIAFRKVRLIQLDSLNLSRPQLEKWLSEWLDSEG